ncbi:MAG: metallophosphoesterase [Aminivibrio sp.]|jgi:predicted phosphodiesterase|nr:metallophosphoesterase [Synergistaceae bacterium]
MGKKWWAPLYGVFFGIYIPEEVKAEKGDIVLHISDTPSTMYGDLERLVKALAPRWIIHTGDLADDVKLELSPRELPRYRAKLLELKRSLGGGPGLVFVTGNHDHEPTMREIFPECLVLRDRGRVELCGEGFNLSHDAESLERPPLKYNLFGHRPGGEDGGDTGRFFLNGISGVYVIVPSSGKIFCLPYPGYVNDGRLVRRKRGL